MFDAHKLAAMLYAESATSLGYPISTDYDYSELAPLLMCPLNNVGDPFVNGHYHVNSLEQERFVLEWFADLFGISRNEFWGYVTNGGTEGNMYALYLARESYPNGIVYYSQDTHYSVAKTVHVLGMRHIVVKSTPDGEIDYADLATVLDAHRDCPAIICANIGTTMKGAHDDITHIRGILNRCAISNYYIHCDAALGGMILPFLTSPPPFDFRDGADSITVSGHKMIGMPMPSGVVIVKKRYVERIRTQIEYINSPDTTLSGSRNGLTPLFLYSAIERLGVEGFRERVANMIEVVVYCANKLGELYREEQRHRLFLFPPNAPSVSFVRNNPYSNIVYFPKPLPSVVNKWQLATQGDLAHVVIMPGVTRLRVDDFIKDVRVSLNDWRRDNFVTFKDREEVND